MASCDIIPQLKRGNKYVPSELFPQLMEIAADREQAKQAYEQTFDPNFYGWFGNWNEAPSQPREVKYGSREQLIGDVQKLFKEVPDLAKYGTAEQYAEYLQTKTGVSRILSHSTLTPFEGTFDPLLRTTTTAEGGTGFYVTEIGTTRWDEFLLLEKPTAKRHRILRIEREFAARYVGEQTEVSHGDSLAQISFKDSEGNTIRPFANMYPKEALIKLKESYPDLGELYEYALRSNIALKPVQQHYIYTGDKNVVSGDSNFPNLADNNPDAGVVLETESRSIIQGVVKDYSNMERIGTPEDIQNFREFLRDSEQPRPQATHATGEPILVSPATDSAVEFMAGTLDIGNKPYGLGMHFTMARQDGLQSGYVKMNRPVRPGQIDAAAVQGRLTEQFGELTESQAELISSLNDMPVKKATQAISDLIQSLEKENFRYIWSDRADIKNVWQTFGYDGIIDGDNYVIFNPYDYWTAIDNLEGRMPENEVPAKDHHDQGPKDLLSRRIELIRKKFGAQIRVVGDLPSGISARVRREGNTPVIEIRKLDRYQPELLLHEFAHILIDGIGGLSNPQVQRGIQLLRGTELWRSVEARYPEADSSTLQKEVLAEAMGREATDMLSSDPNWIQQISNWMSLLMDRIRRVFGLQTNDVRRLARELLDSQLRTDFSADRLPADYQNKKTEANGRDKNLRRKNQVYEETLLNMDYRIQELSQRDDRAAIKQLERAKHELRKDLDKKLTYSGMIYYINQAFEDLDSLYTEMYNGIQQDSLTADQLLQIYTSAQAYKTIPDIEYLVSTNPEMAKELGPEYVQQLNFLNETFEKINRFFHEESIDLAVKFLKPYAKRKREEIAERFRKDWRAKEGNSRANYKGREKQYRLDMNNYVETRMETERADVDAEIENDLRMQLQEAQQDVGSIEMWMTAMKNLDHELLQLVAEVVDQAEYRTIREGVVLKQQIDPLVRGLREYKGNPGDPTKLFEDFLERDPNGNLTRHVVSQYSSIFAQLEKGFLRETEADRQNDLKLFYLKREKFYSEHGKVNPEYTEWKKKEATAKKRLTEQEFQEWEIENRPPREFIAADKYLNPQYNKFNPEHKEYLGDEHPVVKFYNFYMQQQKRFDDMIPIESKRLGYRLPSIRKTTVERIMAGDHAGMIENFRDQFRWTVDDIKRDGTIEDANDAKIFVRKDARGNRLQYVPIHYRSEIDTADQSFDLGTVMLLNGHMSMNYKNKNKVLADLQLVQENLRRRRVGQSRSGKDMFLSASQHRRHSIPGDQSRAHLLMEEFMNFRMFDRHTTERDPFFDYSKQIGTFMSYTGMLLLGGNILAGVANAALGESLFLAEGTAGQFIGMDDWKTAQGYYLRHLANMDIVGDIGNDRYESVINLLMERYDALNTYHPVSHKFGDKNRFQRLFKQHQTYFMNNTGEHMMHNMTMLAMLNRIKVVNNDGKWLTSEGKVTTDPSKAATLLEQFKAEDGQLTMGDVKRVEWDGKFYRPGEDLDFRITQKVRQLNEFMHGAYADQNSNYMQRFTLGRMGIMMRKWIEPGVRRRFAGIKNLIYGKEGHRWDQQLSEFYEGTVTTASRFMINSFKEGEGLKFALAANWHRMSDMERANMHRFATESAIMVLSLTFAHIMYGIARDMNDDEEANKYWYMGYQANRLYSELFFYYPPVSIGEAYRVLKSPAATISVIERTMRLSGQIFSPTEEYASGRRKGDLKIGKYARDMVPFFGPVDRVKNMADLVNIVYN